MASVRKRTWTHKGVTKSAWVVNYTDQGGKRRLKTFKQKKDADKYRTKVETEIEKGLHTADSVSITVAQAARQYLEHLDNRIQQGDRMRRMTAYNYRGKIKNYLLPHLGDMKLTALTAPRIHRWIDDIRYDSLMPASRFTVIVVVQCLRQMIALAQRRGQIATNVVIEAKPDLQRPPKKELEIPTKDEIRLMLAEATGYLKIMLHLAVLTGMRQGEIRAVLWKDIDFAKQIIHVRRSVDKWGKFGLPKTAAGVRDIPMTPSLVKMLEEWRLASPNNQLGLVFCNGNGRPICASFLYTFRWRPFMERIGLADKTGRPKYHFHALRHVAASLLIEQDEKPKVIQRLMGHGSITMTYDTYGHLFNEDDAGRSALAAIDASLLS